MSRSKLLPCRIGIFIEKVKSELSLFGDVGDTHDHIHEMIRHGRLSPYMAGAGDYVLYDAQSQRALVSLARWPAAPGWVDATEPARSIDSYIEFSIGKNALEYKGEGLTVYRMGHRAAAREIAEKLAGARHGENGTARHLQYLGYEKDISLGFSFAYQIFIGENLMNGQLKGFFEHVSMRLTPAKEMKVAVA
jgi:hypothetical protein